MMAEVDNELAMELRESTQESYVLITPARNEAVFIEKTLQSVVAQTVQPLRWVIVSDGSTDGTDDIVRNYSARHEWIELLRLPDRKERNFSGKVSAFNAGYARVKELDFQILGNLDADVSFDAEYFPFLVRKLTADPSLGLVGTPYRDPIDPPSDYRFACIEHVTGPCQVFRRQCFDDIGGYVPVKGGAVDRIADLASRMKGWKTRTFTEKVYLHHRHTGTAQGGVLMSKFRDGGKDYSVGASPLWELFRTVYQMTKRPYVIGSVVMALGYLWAMLRQVERPVPREMVEFCRREQMQRLKALFSMSTIRRFVSPHYFTFPWYIPRIIRLCSNWNDYLVNYLTRRSTPAEYKLRNGLRLFDRDGGLTGTVAVVFVRREYGFLEEVKTIVDIGANMGCFAIYAAQSCPNAKIYCYEPEKLNFEILRKNIRVNALEERVSAFPYAVASKSGPRKMAVGNSLLCSFYMTPPHAHGEIVTCTTLKDIIAAHCLDSIDYLKLNCEGSEYEILETFPASEFARIRRIRMEYHNLEHPPKKGEALARFLEAQGYEINRFSRYRGTSGFIWATRQR